MSNRLELVLITANVGSIFENPSMFDSWIGGLVQKVLEPRPPALFALHLQEVGGKHYKEDLPDLRSFLDKLSNALEPHGLQTNLTFIDNGRNKEQFTALGSVYYVHRSISSAVQVWNFKTRQFQLLGTDSKVYRDRDIEPIETVQKYKFPVEMTPLGRPSRKGFFRTRWQLSSNIAPIEFINIHLFHDESNLVAIKQFPSLYSESRRRALAFTLERVGSDTDENEPRSDASELPKAFFIFGDFNFRLDTGGVVEWLSRGTQKHDKKDERGALLRQEFHETTMQNTAPTTTTEAAQIDESSSSDVTGISSTASNPRHLLVLEKKVFRVHEELTRTHLTSDLKRRELRSYDKELDAFKDQLHEHEIKFPPTYPYSESTEADSSMTFMETRCPSWCDRVVFGSRTSDSLRTNVIEYDIVGREKPTGDHKPVVLRVEVGGGGDGNPADSQHPQIPAKGHGPDDGDHGGGSGAREEDEEDDESNGPAKSRANGKRPASNSSDTRQTKGCRRTASKGEPLAKEADSTELDQLDDSDGSVQKGGGLRAGRTRTGALPCA